MPNTKNPLLRYDIIHSFLDSSDGATIEEMVKACDEFLRKKGDAKSVHRTTICNDLKALRENFDIETEVIHVSRTIKKLRYTKDSPRYKATRFSESDAFNLVEMMKLMSGFVDFPYISPALKALEKKFSDIKGFENVVLFDSTPQSTTKENLYSFYKYIAENKPIIFRYNATYVSEKEIHVQPYLLKQYNNRWFLIGWNYDSGKRETFAIDRIMDTPHQDSKRLSMICELRRQVQNGDTTKIDELNRVFAPRPDDITEMFRDVVGVTFKDGVDKADIVIRVNLIDKYGAYDMNRLETKPIHWSQKCIAKTDEYADYQISVYPNKELYAMLCQYENIEILSPLNVRQAFFGRTRNILNNYLPEDKKLGKHK